MSLNRKEINPLNLLNVRKLNFIPNHFSKLILPYKVDKMIEHWIEYHLNSRYCLKSNLMLDENKKIIFCTEIGLEDPKEISLLTLGCNFIHKHKGY